MVKEARRTIVTNEKDAPERIYMHPTSAEANINPWPLEPGEYVEYIRADLLTAKVKEERDAAFKEAAGTATMMAAGETYETGRQKALNVAAALEAAAIAQDRTKTDTERRTQELLSRATILHRCGTGESAPTISLLFESDTDANTAYDMLMKIREGKRL